MAKAHDERDFAHAGGESCSFRTDAIAQSAAVPHAL